ncbi:M56 family metallopeptidase [Pontixanthobacter aquaemixtae]|uniref:Peptidase M56 domain-containing protein n=1 Tax=Pontixanthobacter aquaemixtae TaxID=1958940 RepID=A0A844ZRT2_9SPHN|nr:M56 family metallopeptidase [Pontixanthobacter aquaemixtae]MXO90448.1 hypothetical protein [Pontixanthobacter aquaemixtae]
MTAEVQSFLLDTLVWTAALIALVLVLRRPVARHFGPHVAYALWTIPLLRLILPPVVLPAWLAPAPDPVSHTSVNYTLSEAPLAVAEPLAEAAPFDWTPLALTVWLVGAAIFLAVRFNIYFRMRDELLEDAYPVGEDGAVRLVETPTTNSPIAFGVFDKVVALPQGFMALSDRTERDLALEHELSHHKAHDLLANFLAQPLFALHWFNPLAWYGWRAMRRDQEAACDARVMAARGGAQKAAYAAVIAGFAARHDATPKLALAAPMACPVIGEKSIIHRLRSLTMTEISPRRKLAGRALMGAALLALPLTASISYAEAISAPSAPVPPAASASPKVTPPAPPAAPLALQAAPEAPDAPEAPEAKEVEREVFVIEDVEEDADGERRKVRKHRIVTRDGKHMTREEKDAMIAEMRAEMAGMEGEIEDAMKEVRVSVIEMNNDGKRTRVETTCKAGKRLGDTSEVDGQRVVHVCKSEVMASALKGLKEARESIAKNSDMSDEMRAEVLRTIDDKIAHWGKER